MICARWACCEGKEEEGRRRKRRATFPLCVCVGIPRQHPRSSQMRPSVPPPTLERALRSSAGKGLQTRTGTRHRTTTHTHSATLHSLSSPPRPPSLARTKRAQTHTNPRKPPPHNHARPCPRGQIGQWGEREGARKKTPFPGPQTPPYLTRAGWAGWGSTQEGQGANFPEGGGRPPPGAGTLSPIYIQIRP